MKIQVEVTKEDIKKGRPGNADACPVAWALYRITGKSFSVGTWSCHCVDGRRFIMPAAASQFVIRFDHLSDLGAEFEPFSFELNEESGREELDLGAKGVEEGELVCV